MTLPNFVYGGAPKAGSSWMFAVLGAHPEIFVPSGKYVQYFTDFYDRGLGWYEKQFASASTEHRAVGDLTTDYLFVPEAAERMARDLPGLRVLFSIRNPIERDWSAYQHLKRVGMLSGPLQSEIDSAHRMLSTCSNYSEAILRANALFGERNVKLVLFDDIRSQPAQVAAEIYAFLGVSPRVVEEDALTQRNPARSARSAVVNRLLKQAAIGLRALGLSDLVRRVKDASIIDRTLFKAAAAPKLADAPDAWRFLRARHDAEIAQLEQLLGRDLDAWRTPRQRGPQGA